ncbi:MAG: hypothetical protein ABI542_05185 [Gemmatimonadota bacterium]
MSHLDDGLIQELLDGEVPSQELPPIQAHLASCAECSARLDEARDFASASDEMIGWLDEPEVKASVAPVTAPDIAPRPKLATWPRNVAWAASLMLAVGLGYSARGGRVPSTPVTPAGSIANPIQQGEETPARDESAADRSANIAASPPASTTPRRSAGATPAPVTLAEREAAKASTENVALGAAADASRQASESELMQPRDALGGSRRERADAVPVERQLNAPAASAAGAVAPQLLARDQTTAKASEARATLDSLGTPVGTVFRIEGLELLRSVLSGDDLRLVYRHPDGEVTLVQRRVGAQMAWHLEAPVDFPAAVLRELRARVK